MLFEVGGIPVYTYGVLMVIAVSAGLVVALLAARYCRVSIDSTIDAAIVAILVGIVCARLEYVLFDWSFFRAQPAAIFRVWQGGLGLQGGLWGGFLGLFVYTMITRAPYWPLADVLALGLAAATVLAWLAAFIGGYAYGLPGMGLLYLPSPDLFGIVQSRFAVQVVGAAVSALLFFLLWWLFRQRRWIGSVWLGYLGVSGLLQLLLGFARGDEALHFWGWRADQYLNLAQFVFAVTFGAYWFARPRSAEEAGAAPAEAVPEAPQPPTSSVED